MAPDETPDGPREGFRAGNGNGSSNPAEEDRRAAERDQVAAEADQTAAESDQTAADRDQQGSEGDQGHSDSDQASSDRDQAAADRELKAHPEHREAYEATRADRKEGTEGRRQITFERTLEADERDRQAAARDDAAAQRDQAAEARERAAEERDRAVKRLADKNRPAGLRLDAALSEASEAREAAARTRLRAAADRRRAARDREHAARDRKRAAEALQRAHLDELTGTYRRGMGETVLQHDIERARRSNRNLLFAYIDVDGLKRINDESGHAAGDEALRRIIAAIQANLRPYDTIVRMGGDEFVCTFSADREVGAQRFAAAHEQLAEDGPPLTFSVGLVEMEDGDSLKDLLARSDKALYDAKHEGD